MINAVLRSGQYVTHKRCRVSQPQCRSQSLTTHDVGFDPLPAIPLHLRKQAQLPQK